MPSNPNPSSQKRNDVRRYVVVFVSFVFLAIAYLILSPNFRTDAVVRDSPLGSDFVQEWTGAFVWLNHRSELYQPERFTAIQHDQELVGFSWPENQFYPMVYPPFYYLVLSPLTMMSYRCAMVLWVLAGALAAATSLCLWLRFRPSGMKHWGRALLFTLTFYPLLMCMSTAHKSTWLLLILTATYLLLRSGRGFAGGVVFGLITFKPHLGLLIGIAMLIKGQWRFVGGALTTVSVCLLLSVVAGWDLCHDYFWQCMSMSDYATTSGYQLDQSHSLVGAVSLLFGAGTPLSANTVRFTAIGVLGLLAMGLWRPLKTESEPFGLQFSLLVIATVLLSPHFYIYDLTIMLLPMAIIFEYISTAKTETKNEATPLPRTSKIHPLAACCLGLFVATGFSAQIAAATGLQITLPILFMMAFLLVRQIHLSCSDPLQLQSWKSGYTFQSKPSGN